MKKYWIFNLILLGCGIIWALTNVGYDEQYQVAMAYRLLEGDSMFVAMWEPHQTSAIFCGLFMWIYKLITHSYDGVFLYLQVVGIVIRALIALLVYKTVKLHINQNLAYAMSVIVFMLSPKDFAMPEFGNMQVWFGIILFCLLLHYFEKKNKTLLIFAAFVLCLQVLAYPSCVIVYIPAVVALFIYTQKKDRIKDIAIFTGICAVFGGVYGGFFLIKIGPERLLDNISGMMSLEPSHTGSIFTKLLGYVKDVGVLALYLLAASVVGAFVAWVVTKKRIAGETDKEKKAELLSYRKGVFVFASSVLLLIYYAITIVKLKDRCAYTLLFVYAGIIGFATRKYLSEKEKMIYQTGALISLGGLVATLLLTDLPFTVSGAYALLFVAVTLIPIYKWSVRALSGNAFIKKGIWICGYVFAGLLVFRCIYVRTPLTGRGQICSTFGTDMSLIRRGPLKGIITDDFSARKQIISLADFEQNVPVNSKLWIADNLVEGGMYLVGNYEVASPSVMSDPKYSVNMEKYWILNPDKMPDVIAVAGYGGDIYGELVQNEWLMGFIESEYRPKRKAVGEYYTFFIKN